VRIPKIPFLVEVGLRAQNAILIFRAPLGINFNTFKVKIFFSGGRPEGSKRNLNFGERHMTALKEKKKNQSSPQSLIFIVMCVLIRILKSMWGSCSP
jgi:hypothetical protein